MNPPAFVSQRISRKAVICLNAPLDQVFPLFGALREKEWAQGWDPQVLYSASGAIEEHMLFQTTPTHGHTEGTYTWLVSKYLPEQAEVEYTVFTAERVWWIGISCRKESGATLAEVGYTFNGLTEMGNHLNQAAMERMFAEDLKDWEREINACLAKIRR